MMLFDHEALVLSYLRSSYEVLSNRWKQCATRFLSCLEVVLQLLCIITSIMLGGLLIFMSVRRIVTLMFNEIGLCLLYSSRGEYPLMLREDLSVVPQNRSLHNPCCLLMFLSSRDSVPRRVLCLAHFQLVT